MTTSTRAVAVALFVDLVIGVAKTFAFLLTGSTAILAEVLHSAADVTNQSLLAVGLARSRRAPDRDYPYGFGRSRYIWALLSAAGVLFVGSGVSVVRGAQRIWAPEPLEHLGSGWRSARETQPGTAPPPSPSGCCAGYPRSFSSIEIAASCSVLHLRPNRSPEC